MKDEERWRNERSETKTQMNDALAAYGKAALRWALAMANCKATFDHRFGWDASDSSTTGTTTTAGGGGGGGEQQQHNKKKKRSHGSETEEESLSGSDAPNKKGKKS